MQRDYRSPWTGIDGRDAVTDDMAVCVAATDPTAIRALIATTPTSEAEREAVRSLSARLGQCLAANAQLKGNRQSIRAALAEALYHRIATPAPAAEPSGTNDRAAP